MIWCQFDQISMVRWAEHLKLTKQGLKKKFLPNLERFSPFGLPISPSSPSPLPPNSLWQLLQLELFAFIQAVANYAPKTQKLPSPLPTPALERIVLENHCVVLYLMYSRLKKFWNCFHFWKHKQNFLGWLYIIPSRFVYTIIYIQYNKYNRYYVQSVQKGWQCFKKWNQWQNILG